MNVFSEVEGLSGEILGSTLLRYLLFNSKETRDSIIELFSDLSPIGPIDYHSHFACRTEYPTQDEELGAGKLDMLIQLDDTAIGVESKFFAGFQSGQPKKYMKTLQDVANALSVVNHSEVKPVLFVICPELRKGEVQKEIHDESSVAIVTWEELLRACKKVEDIPNPVIKVIRDEFVRYVESQFTFIHDFERKVSHLKARFPEYGSSLQAELVSKIWRCFPDGGGRLSNGRTWVGYYFFVGPNTEYKGWFGFLPGGELRNGYNGEAKLIVASTYSPDELDESFEIVELTNEYFFGAPKITNSYHVYKVNFDASWKNIEFWRRKLSPYWAGVQNGEGT